MLQLGLCCSFIKEEIKFRAATARYVGSLDSVTRREYIDRLLVDNSAALKQAISWCAAHGVKAFRINSGLFPLYTHPLVGYEFDSIASVKLVREALTQAGALARSQGIRLSFHPDQFVVPGSPTEKTVVASLQELEYQALVSEIIGAEQLTLHGGGAFGDKSSALKRLVAGLARLSPRARKLIALENDDRVYTPADLLPVCEGEGIRFIYDVHHHRCLPDGMSEEEATERCRRSWGERPAWFHLSSPLNGWKKGDPRNHHDYINPKDVPLFWLGLNATVDVEAKAKELAVIRLLRWMKQQVPAAV